MFLTTFEAMLSMMLMTGLKPLFIRYMMSYLNVAIVEVCVRYFTKVANIVFKNK